MKLFDHLAKNRKSLVIALLLGNFLFAFQNCSPAPEEGEEEGALGSTENPKFAFETDVDTIAYLSCNGGGNGGDFFSYKVAALNEGAGLRFSDAVFDDLNKRKTESIRQILAGHSVNSESRLQLAVRSVAENQNVRTGGSGDVFTHPAPLSSAVVIEEIKDLEEGQKARFFSKATDLSNRQLSAALTFGSEAALAQVSSDLSGNEFSLALTYTDTSQSGGNNAIPVDLNDPGAGVYGRGFNFTFGSVPNTPSDILRVISGVSEKNLADGSDIANGWNCPASLVFRVFRQSDLDANPSLCLRRVDPRTDDNDPDNARRQLVRKVLDPDGNDWWIFFGDSSNSYQGNCIVTKATTNICYGSGNTAINYTQSTCKGGGGEVDACPHFFSICTRQ